MWNLVLEIITNFLVTQENNAFLSGKLTYQLRLIRLVQLRLVVLKGLSSRDPAKTCLCFRLQEDMALTTRCLQIQHFADQNVN